MDKLSAGVESDTVSMHATQDNTHPFVKATSPDGPQTWENQNLRLDGTGDISIHERAPLGVRQRELFIHPPPYTPDTPPSQLHNNNNQYQNKSSFIPEPPRTKLAPQIPPIPIAQSTNIPLPIKSISQEILATPIEEERRDETTTLQQSFLKFEAEFSQRIAALYHDVYEISQANRPCPPPPADTRSTDGEDLERLEEEKRLLVQQRDQAQQACNQVHQKYDDVKQWCDKSVSQLKWYEELSKDLAARVASADQRAEEMTIRCGTLESQVTALKKKETDAAIMSTRLDLFCRDLKELTLRYTNTGRNQIRHLTSPSDPNAPQIIDINASPSFDLRLLDEAFLQLETKFSEALKEKAYLQQDYHRFREIADKKQQEATERNEELSNQLNDVSIRMSSVESQLWACQEKERMTENQIADQVYQIQTLGHQLTELRKEREKEDEERATLTRERDEIKAELEQLKAIAKKELRLESAPQPTTGLSFFATGGLMAQIRRLHKEKEALKQANGVYQQQAARYFKEKFSTEGSSRPSTPTPVLSPIVNSQNSLPHARPGPRIPAIARELANKRKRSQDNLSATHHRASPTPSFGKRICKREHTSLSVVTQPGSAFLPLATQ